MSPRRKRLGDICFVFWGSPFALDTGAVLGLVPGRGLSRALLMTLGVCRIWASELAIVYPHAHIVGLDMSDQQYPPAWTHPANLSFDMYNVLEPPPDKFRGIFDIVHVRLIAGGMRSEADFERAIGHLGELLKPGGYLQWQDVVLPGWQMIDQSLVVDMNDRALPQFAKTFDRALGGIIEKRMTFQLDELARKEGNFREVESVMPAVVPRLLKYETDFAAKSFEETLNGSKAMLMATGGMTEEKGKLFDESQRLLAEYMGGGGLISYKTVVVVGRKVCAQQD
ncbi:hypothetical protein LTR47_000221 [Exophiala xenobiotica]|nr:hypothetical protein LTR92_002236 [Exophiala xenobiotica]KAK5210330.1 hypothetical protein LTR41_003998 [Exophiala xenobiotica]KAK5238478.1 hypothetical protein LTR47_000221 [Exophiala xenobiotica]KAK5302108.1 hypothetical protein LTR14_000357 [Exophiala xenobiotica]KAK5325608.1 hypothetical protein LTR93_003828 [Exophiala xenobiotica]